METAATIIYLRKTFLSISFKVILMNIMLKSNFNEYYAQVFLNECLYKLWKLCCNMIKLTFL